MVEIMFAAHIAQIEARNAKGPDWRHQTLSFPWGRIVIALAVAAAIALLPGLAPRSAPSQHFTVSIGQ